MEETLTTPSANEVNQTAEIIQKKIDSGKLSDQVAKGYKEALNILREGKTSYNDISPKLAGDQARAIGILAVDYLNGEVSQKVLVGIERQEGEDY